ncbi:hypothetical protein AC579_4061 [Pseudocercospora musae]|uniref:DUF7730 domain-containing protein n=1 Tax=Pseudocercospora musae TaxID=113226 RepID=A0A139GYQ9_9PEZI|nr:hypothetical protein AC579_4061 [Pseudocercospora musae]
MSSLFLTILPTEIRLQVYTSILGNSTIHILAASAPLVYTVCCCPNSDSDVHQLSKRDTVTGPAWDEVFFAKDDSDWIRHYERRHERCLRLLKSVSTKTYDVSLYRDVSKERWRSSNENQDVPEWQQTCSPGGCPRTTCHHYQALMHRFGKPTAKAFKKLHPECFMQDLSLLLVCKQVYSEARKVVIAENTFSITGRHLKFSDLAPIFAGDLVPFRAFQFEALQNLHLQTTFLDSERGPSLRLSEVACLTQALPGLVGLLLHVIPPREPHDLASAFQLDMRQHPNVRRPIVARAQVVVGYDDVSHWTSRSWRRGQAIRIERLLTRSEGQENEEECGSGQDVVELSAESELEKTNVPNLLPGFEPERMIHVLREHTERWG